MKDYLSLIKFSHTVFALPFALLGFFLGTLESGQGLNGRLFLLVLLCMIFARSAAMAFNRYLDRDIDVQNPRTAGREIPAGVISPRSALAFVFINSLLFIVTTWFINPICFFLSPVALLDYLKGLEEQLGRETSRRYGPRLIDLDILFFDAITLDTPRLTIPHPRLAERAFVLRPLTDIAPDFIHPILHQSIRDLAAALPADDGILSVRPWSPFRAGDAAQ